MGVSNVCTEKQSEDDACGQDGMGLLSNSSPDLEVRYLKLSNLLCTGILGIRAKSSLQTQRGDVDSKGVSKGIGGDECDGSGNGDKYTERNATCRHCPSQARQTFGSGVVYRYPTARGRRSELYTAWR